MLETAGKAKRRRRICVRCQKRVTFYVYENGVHLPMCGCMGFICATLPYEPIDLKRMWEVDPDAAAAYFFEGPNAEEIDRLNAERLGIGKPEDDTTAEDGPAF